MSDDNKLVMIVDDDRNLTKMIKFLFSTKGFTVQTAESGIEALAMLNESVPAVIILDILMPGMDGVEFMGRMKAVPSVRDVPVVILTAAELEESTKEYLSAGAYDYFDKPFRSDALVNKVLSAIKESRA